VAITPNTRKEDERLRKELQHADLEKFKKVLKAAVLPKKTSQRQSKGTKRH
jgi:formiminotetrahydrofolate cyclodeaminase